MKKHSQSFYWNGKRFMTLLVLCTIGLLWPATAFAAQNSPKDLSSRLDKKIEEFRKLWNIPGLAVGIVKDDRVVFEKGFGYRDIENRLPVTHETQFCIASITKSFTALAAAILVDEKKLDWDRPVAEYLADFRLYEDYPSLYTTLRDLLAHRTGLAESAALYYVFPRDREEVFKRLRYIKPKVEFRTKYYYSNIAYIVAGHMIEKVSLSPYEEFVAERIFKRLGMNNSNFSKGQDPTANLAWPYSGQNNAIFHQTFSRRPVGNPAGGINSTLSDMVKYIRFHLNNGQVEGRALISKQSANEMHKPQMPVEYFAGNPLRGINDYGLGWQIETYRNQILVHHGGWIEGYVSWVSFMPSERLGVVVLSNKQTLLPFLLNWWIYDQMLGLRTEIVEDIIRKNVPNENQSPEGKLSTEIMGTVDKGILGIYKNSMFGEAVVEYDQKNRVLSASFNREVTIPLCGQNGNNYITQSELPEYNNLRVHFNSDYAGIIKNFEIPFYRDMDPIIFEWTAPLIPFDEKYLSRFVGTYDFQGAEVVIRYSDKTLLIKVGDQPEAALSPVSENVFEMMSGEKIIVRFDRFDNSGNALEASVFLPQGTVRTKRVK